MSTTGDEPLFIGRPGPDVEKAVTGYWVFLARAPNGDEGVPMIPGPDGLMTAMIAHDGQRLAWLRAVAPEVAASMRLPITCVWFTRTRDHETYTP